MNSSIGRQPQAFQTISYKALICLDPEAEYEDLTTSLGGCYIDFMNGQYKINPLEPKDWGREQR